MSKIKEIKKYIENMPYGKQALSSEIHGVENQKIINQVVAGAVKEADEAIAVGNKEKAGYLWKIVRQISGDLDIMRRQKEEWLVAMSKATETQQNGLFSNWTNLEEFDHPWFMEKGVIGFGDDLRPLLSVFTKAGDWITKRIQDVTQDWVMRGTEEADFMRMQQDAVKQKNSMGNDLDFDVDFAVSNALATNDAWKIHTTDLFGGRYFLQDYIMENQDKIASGEISDEMLHPTSFNPAFDTRLHQYYTNRIRKGFNPSKISKREDVEASQLMARINQVVDDSIKKT